MPQSQNFRRNVELWSHSNPKQAILLSYVDRRPLVVCKTKKGELNLKKDVKGSTHYYHSTANAAKEAETWFSSLDLRYIQVLYVYGVGLGYYYEAAKEWLAKDQSRSLVFLEDDLAVIHRLFETDIGSRLVRDKQVKLYYFHTVQDSKEVFELIYWTHFLTEMKISALQYYAKEKSSQFDEVHHKIVYDASLKNALLEEYLQYGAPFFKNFYPNMLCMEGAYLGNGLFGKFEKVPAIICGAGPSLAKQLPLLKTLADKALIFAGGSALNALNAADMLPHFGAGIDPNAEQLVRLSQNQAFEVPFFYRNRMFHKAFKMIHGPHLYITGSGGYDISDWFEQKLGIEKDVLDEGHNVVNFCLDIAHAMGCDPIIFVGMDLAFTDMKTYAPGVVSDNKVDKKGIMNAVNFDNAALLRSDIKGKPVYTLWKWIAEADWIGDFAKAHPEITLINSTEGGIGFPGVPNQPLAKAAKKYLKDSYDLFGRVHGEIQNHALPQVKFEKIVGLIKELRDSLQKCIGFFQVLIEEAEYVKQQIRKSKAVPISLQTGRAALFETDLAESPDTKAFWKSLMPLIPKCLIENCINSKLLQEPYPRPKRQSGNWSLVKRNSTS